MKKPKQVVDAYNQYWDWVWYRRYLDWRRWVDQSGTSVDSGTLERVEKKRAELEKQYGADNLKLRDNIDWGIILGRLSGLEWVLGNTDWDDTGDT